IPRGVVELLAEKFNMKQQIIQALREGEGLIVIGYAGNDKSVMDLLRTIPSSHYLFWCVLCGEDENPEDKINDNVKKLLREKDGFLVRTRGFDDVMEQIRQGVGITDDDILSQFRERQEYLTKKLEEAKKSVTVPKASSGKTEASENKTKDEQATEFSAKIGKYSETLSLMFQADEAYKSGNVETAEDFYRRAIELDPNYFSAYNNLAYLLIDNAEKQTEAEKLFRRAIELNPENPGPYINLGLLMERKPERQDEAENFYREAIRVSPNSGNAYTGLARLYLRRGKLKESSELYEKALLLESEPVYPFLGLANIYKKLNDNAKAKEYIEMARSITPKDDWFNLASIEAVAGNPDSAIENLKKAIEKNQHVKGFAKISVSLSWINDDPRFKELVGED
ncbi:MAG TPA: tetratricopeptide repeat protein, partial [Pyrinomonadaceae bacterium]